MYVIQDATPQAKSEGSKGERKKGRKEGKKEKK
jgi:hypothetical protein